MKLKKDGTPSRAGRPKGSTSLMHISLADLTAKLQPNSIIVVGRKWYEQQTFFSAPSVVTPEKPEPEPEEKIIISEIDLTNYA